MSLRTNVIITLAVFPFMAAVTGPAIAKTVYVDAGAAADFNNIQDAIDAVSNGESVWPVHQSAESLHIRHASSRE